MKAAKDIFVKCDELDGLPEPNRRNYLFEQELLEQSLPPKARVLQIGSSDGVRITRLLRVRPDLDITGLEIDADLVDIARRNLAKAGVDAQIVQGDITNPPQLPHFDWVICLNHTLGYIPAQRQAIEQMRRLGDKIAISVYGEKFGDDLAKRYFATIGLDQYEDVRRYWRADVDRWGGQVSQTPIGYFVTL